LKKLKIFHFLLEMRSHKLQSKQTKKDISLELSESLEKVLALRPVSWKWKAPEGGKEIQFGFIAQEVEKVIPHLVGAKEWHDGTQKKYIHTGDLIPYLVSAIKEQQVQIEKLQQTMKKLEQKLKSSK
jgi:hypothetical protein